LHGNTIFSNTSQYYGGGVYLQGVANARLSHNTFDGNQSQEGGGGVFSHQGDHVALAGNTFYSNTTQRGGGVFLYANTNATLDANVVRDNVAQSWGGGLYLYYSDVVLDNNVVVANQAGEVGSGIYAGASAAYLRHTTLARNHGGDGSGIYAASIGNDHSHVVLTNTILVSHVVGINAVLGSSAALNGVLWHGNDVDTGLGVVEVSNSTTGDPAFAADGYHITRASAALDVGVGAGLTTDVDGDIRLLGAGPDLGADEIPRYLAPNRAGAALSGEQALYAHTLFNRAGVTQTFVLSGVSSQGWDVILSVAGDPGGTGTPGDSLILPYALAPGERATITATVQVPGDALSEALDTTCITATGSLVGQDTANDATTVSFNDAAPTLGPDRSGSAVSGAWVVYTHTLTNHANAWLTFDLLAVSSSGLAVSVVPTATASLPPFGGSAVVTVALRTFGGPQESALDTTVVTATAQGYPHLWATASDTTVMSPARIYLPLLVRQ
jgi:parallel beta-helix repeat protein